MSNEIDELLNKWETESNDKLGMSEKYQSEIDDRILKLIRIIRAQREALKKKDEALTAAIYRIKNGTFNRLDLSGIHEALALSPEDLE